MYMLEFECPQYSKNTTIHIYFSYSVLHDINLCCLWIKKLAGPMEMRIKLNKQVVIKLTMWQGSFQLYSTEYLKLL